MNKVCKKCQAEKPIEEFRRSKNTKSGYTSPCLECSNKAQRERNKLPGVKAMKSRLNREWRLDNADYNRKRKSDWTKENRESARKTVNSWRERNREHVRIMNDRYRSLKLGAQGNHSEQEWLSMVEYYEHKCLWCNEYAKVLTRDHVVPLSKGGKNCIHNIQPLCRSHNSEKHAKELDFRYGKYLHPGAGCECS
jgi:hypothetical protein